MQFKLVLLTIVFCLPLFLNAGNTKVGDKTWEGTASYYHNMFEGRMTANGDIFRQKKLTAANNFLPLGTMVRVTNLKNGKSVIVKINDRMNKRLTHRRLIDMSREAARQLGYIHAGLTSVRMEVLPKNWNARKKN